MWSSAWNRIATPGGSYAARRRHGRRRAISGTAGGPGGRRRRGRRRGSRQRAGRRTGTGSGDAGWHRDTAWRNAHTAAYEGGGFQACQAAYDGARSRTGSRSGVDGGGANHPGGHPASRPGCARRGTESSRAEGNRPDVRGEWRSHARPRTRTTRQRGAAASGRSAGRAAEDTGYSTPGGARIGGARCRARREGRANRNRRGPPGGLARPGGFRGGGAQPSSAGGIPPVVRPGWRTRAPECGPLARTAIQPCAPPRRARPGAPSRQASPGRGGGGGGGRVGNVRRTGRSAAVMASHNPARRADFGGSHGGAAGRGGSGR
jgi:hypothetical protein